MSRLQPLPHSMEMHRDEAKTADIPTSTSIAVRSLNRSQSVNMDSETDESSGSGTTGGNEEGKPWVANPARPTQKSSYKSSAIAPAHGQTTTTTTTTTTKRKMHTGRCCCCAGFATDTKTRRAACVFAWVAPLLLVAVGILIWAMAADQDLGGGGSGSSGGQTAVGGGSGGDSSSGGQKGAAGAGVVLVASTYTVKAAVKLDVQFTDIKDMASFEEGAQSSIATALNVSVSRVVITSVTPGSVVIGFEVSSVKKEAADALSAVVATRVKARTAVYV